MRSCASERDRRTRRRTGSSAGRSGSEPTRPETAVRKRTGRGRWRPRGSQSLRKGCPRRATAVSALRPSHHEKPHDRRQRRTVQSAARITRKCGERTSKPCVGPGPDYGSGSVDASSPANPAICAGQISGRTSTTHIRSATVSPVYRRRRATLRDGTGAAATRSAWRATMLPRRARDADSSGSRTGAGGSFARPPKRPSSDNTPTARPYSARPLLSPADRLGHPAWSVL